MRREGKRKEGQQRVYREGRRGVLEGIREWNKHENEKKSKRGGRAERRASYRKQRKR